MTATNARYYTSSDVRSAQPTPIQPHAFADERAIAFADDSPSGLILCDLSASLGLDGPATTPLMLGAYARVRAGDSVTTRFRASSEFYYVLSGSGTTSSNGVAVTWSAGDVLSLPGGTDVVHDAASDSVIWVVNNQPLLALERLAPPSPADSRIQAAHYPSTKIRLALEQVHLAARARPQPDLAVVLGNAALDATRGSAPSLIMSVNSLRPGTVQAAHRHNSVALSVAIHGVDCYSVIDSTRIDWHHGVAVLTPPMAYHSHHNDGAETAMFFIVQDAGLHLHCRTYGYASV